MPVDTTRSATPPGRTGKARKDFEDLIASPDGILLAACRGNNVVGLLAGYATKSSPTRQPVEYAVLRTMYVAEDARRQGVAVMLTDHFLDSASRVLKFAGEGQGGEAPSTQGRRIRHYLCVVMADLRTQRGRMDRRPAGGM